MVITNILRGQIDLNVHSVLQDARPAQTMKAVVLAKPATGE